MVTLKISEKRAFVNSFLGDDDPKGAKLCEFGLDQFFTVRKNSSVITKRYRCLERAWHYGSLFLIGVHISRIVGGRATPTA